MTEYITAENMTLVITAFIAMWQVGKSALRAIAPLTKNETDDKALAAIESAEKKLKQIEENDWIKAYAPSFWVQVEALSKTQIPALKGAGKLAYFLGLAHKAWVESAGTGLSAAGQKKLELEAAALSATAKVSANPQSAPSSM